MHVMSILGSTADAVSLGSWFIVFKVLTLKVAMLTIFLHLSKLGLGFVADFSNVGTSVPTSVEHTPCLTSWRVNAVWISLGYQTLAWWLECSPMAPETWVQSQVESYQRLKKWYTQHYKVQIKGKVEQSRERSSTLPYTSV